MCILNRTIPFFVVSWILLSFNHSKIRIRFGNLTVIFFGTNHVDEIWKHLGDPSESDSCLENEPGIENDSGIENGSSIETDSCIENVSWYWQRLWVWARAGFHESVTNSSAQGARQHHLPPNPAGFVSNMAWELSMHYLLVNPWPKNRNFSCGLQIWLQFWVMKGIKQNYFSA